MSEDKAIRVLESLGGSAELGDIRRQAKKLYPDKQLWRTIHTPLKSLLKKEKVKCRGILKRGGRKNAPKTFWTLANIEEIVPPVKTAAQLLEEEYNAAKTIVKTTEQLRQEKEQRTKKSWDEMLSAAEPPAPPPVIEPLGHEIRVPSVFDEGAGEGGEGVKYEDEKTIAQKLREAIKEPYLDKLQEVVQDVEKKDYKYRGRHDIIYDILRDLKEHGKHGRTITEIMYKSMMSHYQLKKYMITLLKNKLIEQTDSHYIITEKGRHYSDTMDSIPIEF